MVGSLGRGVPVLAVGAVALAACSFGLSWDEFTRDVADVRDAGLASFPEAGTPALEGGAATDADAATTTTAVTRGLLGRWQFEEPDGDVVVDSTAAHNDGVLRAGANGKPVRAAGKHGAALSFGDGSYVEVTNTMNVSSVFSVTFWANTPFSGNAQPRLFAHGDTGYSIKLNGARIQLSVGNNYALSSYTLPTNQWHHFAVVFDGHARWYVDGAAVMNGSDTFTGSETATISGMGFLIGTDLTNPYTGLIDDARLYSVALTPSEIATIYTEP